MNHPSRRHPPRPSSHNHRFVTEVIVAVWVMALAAVGVAAWVSPAG